MSSDVPETHAREHTEAATTSSSGSAAARSSVTSASTRQPVEIPASNRLADQVDALPPVVRAEMEYIARRAATSDEALVPVINLLVPGSPAKRAAIVTAFRTNEPLREQWERTFEILRS